MAAKQFAITFFSASSLATACAACSDSWRPATLGLIVNTLRSASSVTLPTFDDHRLRLHAMDNLFTRLPPLNADFEQFLPLLAQPGLLIERIVSTGQASPPDFWYDQPEGEWVLLLQGEALLRFADEAEARRLRAGDHVDIAPHRRHRVDWTSPGQMTIWLAIHYGSICCPAKRA